MTGRLSGKVAVVTGGTQGIGRGIVLRLASEGAKVVFCSRNPDQSFAVLDELRARGAVGHYVQADLTLEPQATSLVQEAASHFGRVDILVNNAQSRTPAGLIEDKPNEMFRGLFDCGLMASLWTMRAALPHMQKQKQGRIVNFSSVSVDIGMAGKGDYNIAKSAIAALTKSAAQEWGSFGITVNAICPAGANVAIQAFLDKDPAAGAALIAEIPLGRFGDCELDIGSAVLGLVSEDMGFVTGQVLRIDGGAHLKPPGAAAGRLPVKS